MDAHSDALAAHLVLFDLGHIMGDVVDLEQVRVAHLAAQHFLEGLATLVGQHLTVRPGVVGRGLHGGQIILPLGAAHGHTDQLAIGQHDVVTAHLLLEAIDIICTDLMAEAARAAMDLHAYLAGEEAERFGGLGVEHLVDDVDLAEVVAGPQGADLVAPALLGARRALGGVGASHAAALFGAFQVRLAREAAAQRPARPLLQHLIQLARAQADEASLPDAAGDVALHGRCQILQLGGDLFIADGGA